MTTKEVYLDNAASTPVDPKVEAAMKPFWSKTYGNPNALHHFGQKASRAVFESRKVIAGAIGADYEEIIFTGSATEANNLALRGVVKSFPLEADPPSEEMSKVESSRKPRIITTAIEHESVLETCRDLERDGVEVVYIPVSRDGLVDLKKLKLALNDRTILVSVMHANNEVGTIQPISEISRILRNFRESKRNSNAGSIIHNSLFMFPFFHTDAAQSFQYLDCDVAKLGVDLMTLSAHKIYGPKGVGALYANKAVRNLMRPVITGGGQEGGLRSGTENVAGIVGFAKAVELAMAMRVKESERVGKLSDYFWKKLRESLGVRKVVLNGSLENRLPNNLNIYFPGHQAHDLLIRLDLLGIAVSPGAACSTRVPKASYVLGAMGFPAVRASGSLRFSLGRQTTKQEIDHAISVILKVV